MIAAPAPTEPLLNRLRSQLRNRLSNLLLSTQGRQLSQTQVLVPFIQSDKATMLPGGLVTLTGGNWQGDTTVTITVVDAVPTIYRDIDVVVVEPDGDITDSFNLPTNFVDKYYVTAKGAQTGRVVTTHSLTSLSVRMTSAPNDLGAGYSSATPGCRWINGNLHSNNAIYYRR